MCAAYPDLSCRRLGDAGGKELTADTTKRPAPRVRSRIRPNLDEKQAGSAVASALRSAYEEAVKESVPAEFLDLLGKLS